MDLNTTAQLSQLNPPQHVLHVCCRQGVEYAPRNCLPQPLGLQSQLGIHARHAGELRWRQQCSLINYLHPAEAMDSGRGAVDMRMLYM